MESDFSYKGSPIIGQIASVMGWIMMVFTNSGCSWNSEYWSLYHYLQYPDLTLF